VPTLNTTQAAFVSLLENTPELLVKFIAILDEFYKLQGVPTPTPNATPDGPPTVDLSAPPPDIKSSGISTEELDALAADAAEAAVKDRAIAYVRGFVAALMFVA